MGKQNWLMDHAHKLRQKGVFPYEYIDSGERLLETDLPTQEQFYDRLHDEPCSDEDYDRAEEVWNFFGCANLLQYLELYLNSDVFLLADVFENFRNISMKFYKLDPAHYLSAPQLAWDALLKYTDRAAPQIPGVNPLMEIQLQHDPEIYRMVQPALRGGICHAAYRHARANNKYMGSFYDPNDALVVHPLHRRQQPLRVCAVAAAAQRGNEMDPRAPTSGDGAGASAGGARPSGRRRRHQEVLHPRRGLGVPRRCVIT